MKCIKVILVILQLFVIKIVVAPAQKVSEISDAKTAYDLLLTRFKIYIEYYTLSEETKQLYEEAFQYGQNKEHLAHPLNSYNVNEQNYNSNGIFVSLNYFSFGGMYLTTSVSYQWRRYPDSITNDLISIYSNRNIFSAMLLAYIPIISQLTLNGFATYDNDEDIDFDQQNNQSTIFSVELEYIF